LNEADLAVVHEGRDSKYPISDIRFSPDASTLAVASQDNKIYLYDVPGGYAVKGIVESHNSALTHIDFSLDSQYIQSNCSAYELMFSDANSGANVPAVSTLKDVVWSTLTCPLAWSVKGLHEDSIRRTGGNGGAAGTGSVKVSKDSAPITSIHRSHTGDLLAMTDEFGRVKLVSFPALTFGKGETRGKCLERLSVLFDTSTFVL
jgi:WD40 repeat protein